jgi:saccharopine dehydrogenase (NAD+, L-lysine-forming)
MSAARDFDLVLFGATSFVGRLAADYLRGAAPEARIALAGRSLQRLQEVRESNGAPEWALLVADTDDAGSLARLPAATCVLATTWVATGSTGCRS